MKTTKSIKYIPCFLKYLFQGESEVDVIAEQLKFRACLKILMTELRTLATGFEVDGGKLRFQLYSWLEKEIAAMHKICNYKVNSNILLCIIYINIIIIYIRVFEKICHTHTHTTNTQLYWCCLMD